MHRMKTLAKFADMTRATYLACQSQSPTNLKDLDPIRIHENVTALTSNVTALQGLCESEFVSVCH